MGFRNIIIENPARISVSNHQLVIETDRKHHVPIEDICAILIESRQSLITAASLSQLGQQGCAVYFCDERHMPCAVMLPYMQHSRSLSVLHTQLEATEPRKKHLWQSIVKAKIANQAKCLDLAGKSAESIQLANISDRVRSGDPDNGEATAAQLYFPALFGPSFTRSQEIGINSALNYGYAILRGMVSRCLSVYGFLPALGLHHRNLLNSYNLADDLMEPFRPVIDRLVYIGMQDTEQLQPAHKRQLFNALNLEILSGNQRHSVAYAIERLVQSLGKALSDRSAELVLPQLLELKQHSYE